VSVATVVQGGGDGVSKRLPPATAVDVDIELSDDNVFGLGR
jgi:hypothetical protein